MLSILLVSMLNCEGSMPLSFAIFCIIIFSCQSLSDKSLSMFSRLISITVDNLLKNVLIKLYDNTVKNANRF